MSKLWGGRFEGNTDQEVERFTSSLEIDFRLWASDIIGSCAHARALENSGVLSKEECAQIVNALKEIGTEIEGKKVEIDQNSEDIHSEIERQLAQKLGSLAGKLHTGRSRNDQVTTATRLYLRTEIDNVISEIRALQTWLVDTASQHLQTLLPGLTHLQHAQPVSLAHHLMAYFWMLQRDRMRLFDCRKRVNALPLGSAALAGTSYSIDRKSVALELGFETVCENSLDAVSDRDYVVEFLSAGSLILVHLSRLAEEIILWNTPEFGFVTLSDAVTTGSSIMPQKKNPDVAELIRGRVGRLTGGLMGALTVLKGLPLSYNRDLQEDKIHLFQGIDCVSSCVRLTLVMLKGATFNIDKMQEKISGDFSNATDLADYLVQKKMPFREAHEVVGKVVRDCLESNTDLELMTVEKLKKFSPLIEADVLSWLQPLHVMEARKTQGGTSPTAVAVQLEEAKKALKC